MSKANPPAGTASAGQKPPKWWCNFCGFKTDDQNEYLTHSCAEVLKQKGKSVAASDKNACG